MSNNYQDVTASIIAELERGAIPWIKPWSVDQSADRNIVSGKAYQGINRILLGMASIGSQFGSSVWGTYKQWTDAGGQVRKGSKAAHIVFFKPCAGTRVNAAGVEERKGYAIMRGYCVFNAAQVDGIATETASAPVPFASDARAEATIAATGADIRHGSAAAFYSPALDAISLPNKAAFHDPASYYATAFHELTHWTGAKHRLDRAQSGRFADPEYAFEELCAELGAAFLCADHGIKGELRHAGYIGHWIKALRDNERAVFKAAALAQKAADYVLAPTATSNVASAPGIC